jgi:hypothetical protein
MTMDRFSISLAILGRFARDYQASWLSGSERLDPSKHPRMVAPIIQSATLDRG